MRLQRRRRRYARQQIHCKQTWKQTWNSHELNGTTLQNARTLKTVALSKSCSLHEEPLHEEPQDLTCPPPTQNLENHNNYVPQKRDYCHKIFNSHIIVKHFASASFPGRVDSKNNTADRRPGIDCIWAWLGIGNKLETKAVIL